VDEGVQSDDTGSAIFIEDFYLDVFEVTNRRYAECVADGACVEPVKTHPYRDATCLDHPVVFVTLDMAQAYCAWRGARLPTRVEWEKGAGDALSEEEYYWGDPSPVCQAGARLGAAVDEDADFDTGVEAVGGDRPNEFGLYDMTGNAWEWVQDRYEGGEFDTSPSHVSYLRMASWSGYGPVYRRFICSFRCARSP
jgi:formylglycine-generating enzyme required for sulfatase activity